MSEVYQEAVCALFDVQPYMTGGVRIDLGREDRKTMLRIAREGKPNKQELLDIATACRLFSALERVKGLTASSTRWADRAAAIMDEIGMQLEDSDE